MNQDFQNMMAELKKEYISELPKKIELLESLILASQRTELENEFHKLKGTGKTYGLPEVTTSCEKAEESCAENTSNWMEMAKQTVAELKAIVKNNS